MSDLSDNGLKSEFNRHACLRSVPYFKIEQLCVKIFVKFILTSSSWEYLAAFFSASSRESPNPVGLLEAILMFLVEFFVGYSEIFSDYDSRWYNCAFI